MQYISYIPRADQQWHIAKEKRRTCNKQGNLLVQVFNVVPTFLEVSLVAGILAYKCGPAFAGLTAATITLYTLVTFAITSVSFLCHPPPPQTFCPTLTPFCAAWPLGSPGNPSLSPLQPHDPLTHKQPCHPKRVQLLYPLLLCTEALCTVLSMA